MTEDKKFKASPVFTHMVVAGQVIGFAARAFASEDHKITDDTDILSHVGPIADQGASRTTNRWPSRWINDATVSLRLGLGWLLTSDTLEYRFRNVGLICSVTCNHYWRGKDVYWTLEPFGNVEKRRLVSPNGLGIETDAKKSGIEEMEGNIGSSSNSSSSI